MATATRPAIRALLTIRPMFVRSVRPLRGPGDVRRGRTASRRRRERLRQPPRESGLDVQASTSAGVERQLGGRWLDEQHAAAAGQAEVGDDAGRRLRPSTPMRQGNPGARRCRRPGARRPMPITGTRRVSSSSNVAGRSSMDFAPDCTRPRPASPPARRCRWRCRSVPAPRWTPPMPPGCHHADAGQAARRMVALTVVDARRRRGEQRAEVTGARLAVAAPGRPGARGAPRPRRPPAAVVEGGGGRHRSRLAHRALRGERGLEVVRRPAAPGRSGSTRAPPPARPAAIAAATSSEIERAQKRSRATAATRPRPAHPSTGAETRRPPPRLIAGCHQRGRRAHRRRAASWASEQVSRCSAAAKASPAPVASHRRRQCSTAGIEKPQPLGPRPQPAAPPVTIGHQRAEGARRERPRAARARAATGQERGGLLAARARAGPGRSLVQPRPEPRCAGCRRAPSRRRRSAMCDLRRRGARRAASPVASSSSG